MTSSAARARTTETRGTPAATVATVATAEASRNDPEPGARTPGSGPLVLGLLVLALIGTALFALSAGRFHVPAVEVARILGSLALPLEGSWTDQQATVVLDVRLPRLLLAMLVGAGLALSGAAMQAVFRNPLASAQVLGVSAGASFGGVLMILAGLGGAFLVGGAFLGGLTALALVLVIARVTPGSPLLMVILAGTVIGAMFNAFVSMLTYVADPNGELPSIVFWLMGSIATASYPKLLLAAVPIVAASGVILALRWRVNILSMGDDD
ncbi:FecCD family ABC transporter permease, partial [Leucobacter sp. M11]|uniref:FecCD family ABC transporter permease n=1 Tax=Leucobacter sp. M11 TaxID=2993565 RepID=UPI002D7F8E06